eukprot:6212313-Pleurochrysis_carterae.AAC.12
MPHLVPHGRSTVPAVHLRSAHKVERGARSVHCATYEMYTACPRVGYISESPRGAPRAAAAAPPRFGAMYVARRRRRVRRRLVVIRRGAPARAPSGRKTPSSNRCPGRCQRSAAFDTDPPTSRGVSGRGAIWSEPSLHWALLLW